MDQLSKEELKDLLAPPGEPCVSLYMPTNRAPVEGRQDPIRFKNLLRDTEERLVQGGMRGPEAKEFLAPLQKLLDDLSFWQYRGDGLAVFHTRGMLRPYRLPVQFEELVVVGRRFHLKPLIPLLTEDSGYYVLALSQNEVRLLQGNRYGAWQLELEHIPTSLAEAVPYDDPERQFQLRGNTSTPMGGRRQAIFFSHGTALDDSAVKEDIGRFFHQLDKGLQEVLRPDGAPLVLAGVEYLFPIYREANSYPNLLGEGIPGNPELLSPEELHARAWKVVQPGFLKARQEAISHFEKLAGTGRATQEIKQIVPAAFQGRIYKLIVALGAQVWGNYLPDPATVEVHGTPTAASEDLLDLAAIQTLLNGGKVYTVDPGAIPGNAPIAAVLRY